MYLWKFFFYFFISDNTAFSSSNPHAFQINFNSLYTALCEQQKSDQATLLLYMLLHQNSNVRTYVLARTDIENLVSRALPVLFSSRGTGPASLGVTSCHWPLFCSGSSRFWITHSPVLAHLLIFVTSSPECGAKHVTAVKEGTGKAARPCWISSFSVPLIMTQVKPAHFWSWCRETGSRYHSIHYFIYLFQILRPKSCTSLLCAFRSNS